MISFWFIPRGAPHRVWRPDPPPPRPGRRWWLSVFVAVFLAILVLFLQANGGADAIQPHELATRPKILLVEDFYYPPMDGTLAYPNCKLGRGFEFPGGVASDLVDYAFLSAMGESGGSSKMTLMSASILRKHLT